MGKELEKKKKRARKRERKTEGQQEGGSKETKEVEKKIKVKVEMKRREFWQQTCIICIQSMVIPEHVSLLQKCPPYAVLGQRKTMPPKKHRIKSSANSRHS